MQYRKMTSTRRESDDYCITFLKYIWQSFCSAIFFCMYFSKRTINTVPLLSTKYTEPLSVVVSVTFPTMKECNLHWAVGGEWKKLTQRGFSTQRMLQWMVESIPLWICSKRSVVKRSVKLCLRKLDSVRNSTAEELRSNILITMQKYVNATVWKTMEKFIVLIVISKQNS